MAIVRKAALPPSMSPLIRTHSEAERECSVEREWFSMHKRHKMMISNSEVTHTPEYQRLRVVEENIVSPCNDSTKCELLTSETNPITLLNVVHRVDHAIT